MKNFFAMFAADYYKIGHAIKMQPQGAEMVYSTWTARSNKHHPGCDRTVVFGYQYTISELKAFWDENFFNVPVHDLERQWEAVIGKTFDETYCDFSKFYDLHELGYLPIAIYGVPEGTLLPIGIPDHVIFNTHPNFAWLPQFIEDQWSANNWLPSTSATTAYYRRKLLAPYVKATHGDMAALDHMCGDFSLRGHTSLQAGYISGAAHALSFDRTATIGSNLLLRDYYNATMNMPPMRGTPSLEHSVVEQGVADYKQRIAAGQLTCDERFLFKEAAFDNWDINLIAEMLFLNHLLTEIQPTGVMTYVSDTYDYWGVVSKVLPLLKNVILARDGVLSVRPDSGNPVKIICGDPNAEPGSPEFMGTLGMLWDTFGGTMNDKSCRVLDPHIRMIYGDAITPEITEEVGKWCLKFAYDITNISFGIGAYTYQYVTRDTRGYAIKATDCIINREEFPIYKMPKTDPGKKSPRGAVAIVYDQDDKDYRLVDGLTLEQSLATNGNIMVKKFENGDMFNIESFEQIRARLRTEEEVDKGRDNKW